MGEEQKDLVIEPATVCAALLAAMGASEGRRKKRKRDTTPDSIGMEIKRKLLERAVHERPPGAAFEGWLLQMCEILGAEGYGVGAVRAMARSVLDEWQFAEAQPSFREWLARGAPSADADEG
jgi:hypothetical protein